MLMAQTTLFSLLFLFAGSAHSFQNFKCLELFKPQRIEFLKVEKSPEQLIESVQLLRDETYAHQHPEEASVIVTKAEGLDHTYLAVFNNSVYMNWALGRITTHQTQNKILTDIGISRKNSPIHNFAGHDIPSDVFQNFERAFKQAEKTNTPATQFESEFYDTVLKPIFRSDPKAVLVAVSLNVKTEKILSHELLHATFYEMPELQDSVEDFWNTKVTAADKELYLNVLKREGYNVDDHEQVINEFFAYTLEKGKPIIFPPTLIERYRLKLSRELSNL